MQGGDWGSAITSDIAFYFPQKFAFAFSPWLKLKVYISYAEIKGKGRLFV